jgi:hypothetical protein
MNIVANGDGVVEKVISAEALAAEFRSILAQFKAKDPAAAERLAAYARNHPDAYAEMTELRTRVRTAWSMVVVPDQAELGAYTTSFEKQLADHERLLAGDSPSGIESTLARQAALDWLQVQALSTLEGVTATTAASGRFRTMLDSAHRRYERMLRTLAVVRRLGKGMEIQVTHKTGSSSPDLPASGEEREVRSTEATCVRAAGVASRLQELEPALV